MSSQEEDTIGNTDQSPTAKKITSHSIVNSQKQLNNPKEDINVFKLSHNLQRSTYLSNEDFDSQIEEIEQQSVNSPHVMTSVYGNSRATQEVQKPKQPKIQQIKNIEKSIKHHPQHQDVYESISSDNSADEKPQQQKEIKSNLATQKTSFKNHQNSHQQIQSIFQNNSQNFCNNSESIIGKNMQAKQSPIISSGKYNISPKKQSIFEENHTNFELGRKNFQRNEETRESIFKRQQSTDFKQIPSQRSNRINIEKSQQNTLIKYPSVVRSSSQESGHIKFQTKSSKVELKQLDFQQSKNSSTSQKNLAYVSKRFTSEQPSPKRNDQFNEVYEIVAPAKSQKQSTPVEEIRQSENSSMLYVSASGQVLYPSLDLKRKAQQLESRKESQQIKNDSFKYGEKKESRRQKQERRRKSSNEPQLPCRIKILQYRSEYFLKIQTQVFDIEVQFPPDTKVIEMKNMHQKQKQKSQQPKSDKNYKIKRRFSDFAFLYQGITTNQIGYIIYPFPSKSLESFVKIKLQSLIGTALSEGSNVTEAQKMQLLERRIEELQNFVNFLISHDELKFSEELGIFLCEDQETYQRSRERIEKYIEEYKDLDSSSNMLQSGKKNIKKALETGFGMVMKWWGSPEQPVKQLNNKIQKSRQSRQFLIDTVPQQDIEFGQYFESIGICLAKFQMLERSLLKLVEINQKLISFKDIDTEFDYLVKLCAKVSSGKQYSKNLVELIDYDLIKDIQIGRRWLQQSKEQLIKREELKELIENLKASLTYANDESSKISKLERRLERFQKNFRYGFSSLIIECEKIFERSRLKFVDEWKAHSEKMKKIWK